MKKCVNRHYRMDEITVKLLKDRCEKLGINESEYVRCLILQDSYRIDREQMREVLRGISDVGNKLNHIASNGIVTDKVGDIVALRKELFEIRKLVMEMMSKTEGGS